MLRKFAAALVATALIAGPALAAQSSSTAGSTPATPAAAAAQAAPAANAKPTAAQTVKPTPARKHVARGKTGKLHMARHVKPAKTHQANTGTAAKRS
jgi:hypothetical protein